MIVQILLFFRQSIVKHLVHRDIFHFDGNIVSVAWECAALKSETHQLTREAGFLDLDDGIATYEIAFLQLGNPAELGF